MRKSVFLLFMLTQIIYSQEKACTKVFDSITKSEVYEIADIMPEPRKGMSALQKKIRSTIKLGDSIEVFSSIRAGIAFIICEDGSLNGERVLFDTTDFQLGEQLLSIAISFEWISGKCENISVPVIFKLPIVIDVR